MRWNRLFVRFAVALLAATAIQGPCAAGPHAVARGPQFLAARQSQFAQLVATHRRAKAHLPADMTADLDKLARHVRKVLFSRSAPGDLLGAATQIVSRAIPALTQPESRAIAVYTLNEIASEGAGSGGTGGLGGTGMGGGAIGSASGGDGEDQLLNATKQMQETQMSFNLQYLQLQSQMQNDNRQYTMVSNIMKNKHDTAKNSINNIR